MDSVFYIYFSLYDEGHLVDCVCVLLYAMYNMLPYPHYLREN